MGAVACIEGVTDSPLWRACIEADETPTHVMLECTGVEEQRVVYLRSPATFPEVLTHNKREILTHNKRRADELKLPRERKKKKKINICDTELLVGNKYFSIEKSSSIYWPHPRTRLRAQDPVICGQIRTPLN
ncbi:jg8922 [Pararge aegeria aegeria]|uniref:Jg8922 protein n=1 Tax=Pararge aegeria aegeria TaxID=348720 RepID=A0A8S4SL51_9NEOP|nr:jg8922 [Pararge aegeria aegeria]